MLESSLAAATPDCCKAATWSVISAISGETTSPTPGRNNADADLTGVLLAHGDWFLQAIEGSRESVLMAYGRIVDDPRHGEAKVLGSGPAEGRAFQAWCVCAGVFGAADAAILEALTRRGPFDAGRLTERAALKLLQGIEAIKMRAATAA